MVIWSLDFTKLLNKLGTKLDILGIGLFDWIPSEYPSCAENLNHGNDTYSQIYKERNTFWTQKCRWLSALSSMEN